MIVDPRLDRLIYGLVLGGAIVVGIGAVIPGAAGIMILGGIMMAAGVIGAAYKFCAKGNYQTVP